MLSTVQTYQQKREIWGFADGSIGGLGVYLLCTILVTTWFIHPLFIAVQKVIRERSNKICTIFQRRGTRIITSHFKIRLCVNL